MNLNSNLYFDLSGLEYPRLVDSILEQPDDDDDEDVDDYDDEYDDVHAISRRLSFL